MLCLCLYIITRLMPYYHLAAPIASHFIDSIGSPMLFTSHYLKFPPPCHTLSLLDIISRENALSTLSPNSYSILQVFHHGQDKICLLIPEHEKIKSSARLGANQKIYLRLQYPQGLRILLLSIGTFRSGLFLRDNIGIVLLPADRTAQKSFFY